LSETAGVLLREIVDRQELAVANIDRQSCACDGTGLELSVCGERSDRENRDRQ